MCCLAKSFAVFDFRDEGLWKFLGDEVCHETRAEDWPAFQHWFDLVTSAAEVNQPHAKMFGVAATPLRNSLNKVRSGASLVKLAKSYAQFGFRHDKLFMEIARVAPATTITLQEIDHLLSCFKRIQFRDEFLEELREFRKQ